MQSGFRHLAALCALLALSLFWVEGVWASMCPPGMEMDAAAAMAADVGPDAEACPAGSTTTPSDPDESRSEGPHCPLMAIGASCTVSVPLGAESATPVVALLEAAPLAGSPDHAKDLLLAVALFHPPRA